MMEISLLFIIFQKLPFVTRPFFGRSNVSSKIRPAVNKQFTSLKVIIRREVLNQLS